VSTVSAGPLESAESVSLAPANPSNTKGAAFTHLPGEGSKQITSTGKQARVIGFRAARNAAEIAFIPEQSKSMLMLERNIGPKSAAFQKRRTSELFTAGESTAAGQSELTDVQFSQPYQCLSVSICDSRDVY
jgi:hypothetical protein